VGSDGRAGAICANGSVETLAAGRSGASEAGEGAVQGRQCGMRYAQRRCDGAAKRTGIRRTTRAVVRGVVPDCRGGWWRSREVFSSGRVVLSTTGGERRAVSRLALGGWGERGVRERLGGSTGSEAQAPVGGRYTEQRASRGGEGQSATINQY
jgi:hypothetical protein